MNSLTSAITTVRRSPIQSMTVIVIISLIAFVGYFTSLITFGAQALLDYAETQPQVIAFFKLKTPMETIEQIETQFRNEAFVNEVSVITQDQALEIYREENQDEPLLLELVTADILPASIEIKAINLDYLTSIKEQLEQQESVDEVVYQQETIDQLKSITQVIRSWGLIILSVLAGTAFLVTNVIIALKASSQRKKISILRLLGASKKFVKTPFMIEGMFYGFFGSLLGWIFAFATSLSLSPKIANQIDAFFPTISLPSILIWQLFIGSGVGLILGGVAGFTAITRLIKK